MNILFFLTPKKDVAYLESNDTLRGALEKIEYHRYTAVPLLDSKGRYIGTVTEGDILRKIKEDFDLTLKNAEEIPITSVNRRWRVDPVNINCEMDDLLQTATQWILISTDSRLMLPKRIISNSRMTGTGPCSLKNSLRISS